MAVRRSGAWLIAVVGAYLVVPACVWWLGGIFAAFTVIPILGLAMTGWAVSLLVVSLRRGFTQSLDWRRAAGTVGVQAIAIAVAIIAAGPTMRVAGSTLMWTHFLVHRATYRNVVALVEAGQVRALSSADAQMVRGVEVVVAPGIPTRVAFPRPAGFRHVYATIYDPSGAVASARGYADADGATVTAFSEVREAFGQQLLECVSLERPFYYCRFVG